jgi:hypothetical protein
MGIVKVLLVALAALFAASTVQAATFVKPAGTPGIESMVELTKGKKKAKKAKKGKKAAKAKGKKKGPGQCGAYMYYKGGKCMDARAKK